MFNVYEMLTPTLLKLSQKVAEERILPSSFCETTITLINETRQRYHRKGNYRPVSLMNIDRDANRIQQHIIRIIHPDQVGFTPEMQGFFNVHTNQSV